MRIDDPFALLGAVLAFWLGWVQFRQAREPLVESHYPFVKTKSRGLRIAMALWGWFVGLVGLVIAF